MILNERCNGQNVILWYIDESAKKQIEILNSVMDFIEEIALTSKEMLSTLKNINCKLDPNS